MTFIGIENSDHALLDRIAATVPESPFNTAAYAQASAQLGATVCAFLHETDSGATSSGCIGLLRTRHTYRRLEIPSAPHSACPSEFWAGVRDFCTRNKVTELSVDTFASQRAVLPDFPRRLEVRKRLEYVLDLERSDGDATLSKNHRRNIKKASRSGVVVNRSRERADCINHVTLMDASLARRRGRGEIVDADLEVAEYQALLDAGAGELYQARLGGKLLSSILILRSADAGYYHTAGTLPEGMSIGASPFLVHAIADSLAHEGCRWFNLGGADLDAEGLRRFKRGFGAEEIALEAARYSMVTAIRRLGTRLYSRLMNRAYSLVVRTG